MVTAAFLAQNSIYMENLMRHRFVYDVTRYMLQRNGRMGSVLTFYTRSRANTRKVSVKTGERKEDQISTPKG